jgi:hypothetical protein
MTAFLLIALIVSLAVAATTALVRWLGDDGGPRRPRLQRFDDSWSNDQPSRPYATL